MRPAQLLLAVTFFAFSLAAPAQEPTAVRPAVEKAVRDALKSSFTAAAPPVQKIRATPYAGLLEVSMNDGVFYVTPDARFLIQGAVIDTRTLKDLTETRAEPFPRFPPMEVFNGTAPERIRHLFTTRLKDKLVVDEMAPSAVPGLWEVVSGTQIFYTNDGVDFVLPATLIDLARGVDLTQARLDQLKAIPFSALPLQEALVYRRGSGTRRLVVFADPLDSYAQRLQRELAKMDDITVYFFLVAILGPQSGTKARDILCSASPAETWRAWMAEQRPVPAAPADCPAAALERNAILAERYRLAASPILVFADSNRVEGTLTKDELEKRWAAAAAKGAK